LNRKKRQNVNHENRPVVRDDPEIGGRNTTRLRMTVFKEEGKITKKKCKTTGGCDGSIRPTRRKQFRSVEADGTDR